jgi:hypothetical protein
MKMSDEEKRLLEVSRKLESKTCRDFLIKYGEAMVQGQEALKKDYGLVGRDAPLFNGVNALTA